MKNIYPSLFIDARLVNNSGIGRYLSELLPRLKTHFNITCIINASSVEYVKSLNLGYIICSANIYSLKEQYYLPKMVAQCDVFWSPHFNIPIMPLKAKFRVVTIHDAYHLAFKNKLSFSEKIYAKIFYRLAIILSTQVITVSSFSKEELLKYIGYRFSNKIKVIHNGVSNLISKENHHNLISRSYWLFVGNVKPHKNLMNALIAFKEFCISNPSSKLYFKIVGQRHGFINGDKALDILLSNDIVLKEKVNFTGYVKDEELSKLYKNAFCLVFPSFYEGFGLPPLEAMQLGTPTIISNSASMPELCESASIYFNPHDPTDIHRAMQEIFNDKILYAELISKGIKQAKKYSWEICSQKHLNLFLNIIKNENCDNPR